MSDRSAQRDWLAIAIGLLGFATQIGAWFYWGGKLETRVAAIERRQERHETIQSSASAKDGEQDVKIAVSVSQQSDIIVRLQRIEDKLEARR